MFRPVSFRANRIASFCQGQALVHLDFGILYQLSCMSHRGSQPSLLLPEYYAAHVTLTTDLNTNLPGSRNYLGSVGRRRLQLTSIAEAHWSCLAGSQKSGGHLG